MGRPPLKKYRKGSEAKRGFTTEIEQEILRSGDSSLADSSAIKLLDHKIRLANLPPVDYTVPQQVWQRSFDYFDICKEAQLAPTMSGYALALGLTLPTLRAWMKGKNQTLPEETYQAFGMSFAIINATLEDWLMYNKVNVAGGIFLLKHHFGYRDNNTEPIVNVDDREAEVDNQALIDEAMMLLQAGVDK